VITFCYLAPGVGDFSWSIALIHKNKYSSQYH
jgi:hypothetical protein